MAAGWTKSWAIKMFLKKWSRSLDLTCQEPWDGVFQGEDTEEAGIYGGNKPAAQLGKDYLSMSQRGKLQVWQKEHQKGLAYPKYTILLAMERHRLSVRYHWGDTVGL